MKTMEAGEVVAGKFEVVRVLGEGGMGVVVAARQLELERMVALKFMRDDVARSAEACERFLREAKAAARLRGDHVAQVLDVGRLPSGAPYIVMEYLEGRDLAQLLEAHGALAIDEAIAFVLQTCEAMAEAHGHGIVHRDLKPQNLFVTARPDGTPWIKVLDFGISKAQRGDGPTKTHQAIGTPAYMAPEQMRSARTVDGRADIWSLGVILYQLLSNALPFIGDTFAETMLKALADPAPPISTLRADVPAALARVIERCLAKDRDQRYPTIAALAHDLAPFAPASAASLAAIARAHAPGPIQVVPPALGQATTLGTAASALSAQARPTATRWSLIGAAIATVVAVVVITILATRRPAPDVPAAAAPPPDAARIEPKVAAELTFAHEVAHDGEAVALSPSPAVAIRPLPTTPQPRTPDPAKQDPPPKPPQPPPPGPLPTPDPDPLPIPD